ncbi:kinase-like protein [Fragilariopsis cylindrus CCMP1102]|uniref:Kinase-like protein n=1 Tax=Fragilariopsis cylindrus CCMP1102 TaxID=635003 RepID=A0A1E7FT77_9STRA|nr:kinase-like protein [Fragilariopsis cylindrus CCMP1102]|eukprot:OEU21382.1 kinase-like protein [Fragilariopsis cylindrus CCMP1102]
MRRLPSPTQDVNTVISFSEDFEILSSLGSGTFADVYKVRLKSDDHLYAVKRNRRQFRGKRDRDMALAEVQSMQQLQSVFANTSDENAHKANLEKNCYSLYLLFFHRAWQEDGYFYSQTELCSGSQLDAFGRIVPNMTAWKICHDISAGLSHIHSHGIVHQDIKPSNIFLVANARFGAMCKIGDFGMAGSIGSSGDGQEGDARYMPPELLTSATRHTSSDIFSLGLTLYEIAMEEDIEMPSEGPHWHQLRSSNEPKLPSCRGDNLQLLLQSMTNPDETRRPTADTILENENVNIAGHDVDTFLQDYIKDVEEYDRKEEIRLAEHQTNEQTPRNGQRSTVRSPSLNMLIPAPPTLFSPPAKFIQS